MENDERQIAADAQLEKIDEVDEEDAHLEAHLDRIRPDSAGAQLEREVAAFGPVYAAAAKIAAAAAQLADDVVILESCDGIRNVRILDVVPGTPAAVVMDIVGGADPADALTAHEAIAAAKRQLEEDVEPHEIVEAVNELLAELARRNTTRAGVDVIRGADGGEKI